MDHLARQWIVGTGSFVYKVKIYDAFEMKLSFFLLFFTFFYLGSEDQVLERGNGLPSVPNILSLIEHICRHGKHPITCKDVLRFMHDYLIITYMK